MRFSKSHLLWILLASSASLSGCDGLGEPEVIPYTTRDVQVDRSLDAEVGGHQLCVSGPNVYAVWHDDRRSGGRNQIFFNVGRGGGAYWEDADVQLSSDPEGTSTAENPSIACAGDSIYVVWEDDRDSEFGDKNIYFSYSDDAGDSWRVDQRVTSDSDGDWDTQGPRVAVDYDPAESPDKHVYITWYDNRRGAYDIYFTRSTNGYNFLPEELRLDTDAPGVSYSAHPKLATDGQGGVYVAWEDSRDGGNDVYVNSSANRGDSWASSDVRLDTGESGGASESFGVSLAVDRDSSEPAIYVAWHDERNGATDIFLSRSLDAGGSWDDVPTRLDGDVEGGADSFYPTVVASQDRVTVAWHDNRDVGFDVLARTSSNAGSSWGEEVRLETDVAGSAHSLQPQVVGVGQSLAAVWTDYRREVEQPVAHPDIYYRTSADGGGTWSEADQRIDDDPQSTAISDQPRALMVGPSVYVLWVDYRAGNADLYFRRVPAASAQGR